MKSSIKLKFNDKELEFVYGLSFLGQFYKDYSKNVNDIVQEFLVNPHGLVPELMYESYKHNLVRQGLSVNHTVWEFSDLLEECGGVSSDDSPSVKFMEVFIESLKLDLPETEDKEVEEVKKK